MSDAKTGASLAHKLFRSGPIILIPLMLGWGIACWILHSEEDQSWYFIFPGYGAMIVAIIWIVALLIFEKPTIVFLLYAVLFLPIFYYVDWFCVYLATRFPL